eukprot:m.157129 g.157129  ORF g.157129 m.157129 type:complete len:275 (+) comp31041_c0_seq1:246-1070(+)
MLRVFGRRGVTGVKHKVTPLRSLGVLQTRSNFNRSSSSSSSSSSSKNTMKLWTCPGSRGTRVCWALHELGVADECELVSMPFPPRVTHPEYLQTNVLGTIPYFEDGERCKMTESVGICVYLVQKYSPTQLSIQPHEVDYPAYLNWLFHADATLTFPQTVVLRYTLQEKGKADAAVEGYARFYLARLRMLNQTLADGREFLCGGRFTIADIAIAYALSLGLTLRVSNAPDSKLIAEFYKPHVTAYMNRMLARPGYITARDAEDDGLKEFETKAKL